MDVLTIEYFGNSLQAWVTALAVFFGSWIMLRVLKRVVHKRLKKFSQSTVTEIDDLAVELLQRTQWYFFAAIALFIGGLFVTVQPTLAMAIRHAVVVALLFQAIVWGNRLIAYVAESYKRRNAEADAASTTSVAILAIVGKVIFIALIILVGLDNFGFDITALVAGLGIGGIAVALAVQNILGDLLSSLTIMFDKPFVVGDFIIVDDFMGTVEHVGLKTTRLRSISGEQAIFSNSDLLGSRIRNYKRMNERRANFTLGVTYQTSYEKLQAIPGMLQKIIEGQPHARFDRSHFKSYGDFSLNFETVYYVAVPDFASYMDTQQAINLEVYRQFSDAGIEFAYPTQTLFMEKSA